MIRLANMNVVLIAITVALAFGNYRVKDEAERTAKRIAALDRAIAKEDEALRTLEAEWSYLSEPSRLQDLAVRHLALTQIRPAQVTSVERLGDRLPLSASGAPAPKPGIPTDTGHKARVTAANADGTADYFER